MYAGVIRVTVWSEHPLPARCSTAQHLTRCSLRPSICEIVLAATQHGMIYHVRAISHGIPLTHPKFSPHNHTLCKYVAVLLGLEENVTIRGFQFVRRAWGTEAGGHKIVSVSLD
jgi:hypothetical protein